jgi:hypothetical protein
MYYTTYIIIKRNLTLIILDLFEEILYFIQFLHKKFIKLARH